MGASVKMEALYTKVQNLEKCTDFQAKIREELKKRDERLLKETQKLIGARTEARQDSKNSLVVKNASSNLDEFCSLVRTVVLPVFRDPVGWISRAENYFKEHGTTDESGFLNNPT